jgi:hypothetical protein
MDISRIPSGLPPSARDETMQRLQNGRGGDVGGDPKSAERRATAERAAADRAAARVQTTEAVGRATRPDLTEPTRDAATPRSAMERGGRLDLRV